MRRVLAVAVALGAMTVGIAPLTPVGARAQQSPGPPEVVAPQRYIDPVFPQVAVAPGRRFATVIDVQGVTRRLLLDVYEPAGDVAAERPAVIWVHGGSFTSGDRSDPTMVRWARHFAMRGYVTLSIDYRLEPAEGHEARALANATADARAAVRWLRRHAAELRVDQQRISIGGYSAGAATALHTAYSHVTPGGPNADFSPAVAAAISIAGLTGAQPDPGEAPAVMFHGSADTTAAYQGGGGLPGFELDAVSTCRRIRAAGLDCTFYTHAGAGHDLSSFEPVDQARALQFLSCRVGAASLFADTAGTRYADHATWATRTGLFDARRRFRGDEALTRSVEAQALWALLDRPADGPTPPSRPGEPTGRGRFVTRLWRAVGSPTGSPAAGFTDVGAGATAAAADWARAHDLLDVRGSRFEPQAPVSRGQAATVAHRVALTPDAWSPALRATPPSTACFRVGDPPT